MSPAAESPALCSQALLGLLCLQQTFRPGGCPWRASMELGKGNRAKPVPGEGISEGVHVLLLDYIIRRG